GITWSKQVNSATDPDMSTGINAIETVQGSSPYLIIAAPRGLGVFTSTSTTTNSSWILATGLAADRVRSLSNHSIAAPNTYYVALENGTAMKSTDAGATWIQLYLGLNNVYGNVTTDYVRSGQVIAAHPSNTSIVALGV